MNPQETNPTENSDIDFEQRWKDSNFANTKLLIQVSKLESKCRELENKLRKAWSTIDELNQAEIDAEDI